MKYSEVNLTDDNFDEEYEKLCEIVGIPHYEWWDSVKKLTKDFTKQEACGRDGENLGFEEWVRGGYFPNNTRTQAYHRGEVAYQFGNCFIIKKFDCVV